MRRSSYILLFCLFYIAGMVGRASAQTPQSSEAWTLQQCIDYAVSHNIDVQQLRLQSEERAIQLSTSKNSRLPDVRASIGENVYFGRGPSRDGTYQDNTQISTNMSVTTNINVFSGFRVKHEIATNQLNLNAALQDFERAREDVALNVTSLYLQALFNKELKRVAEIQVALSKSQVERSTQLVESGRSPESALYESKAVLAKDELSLVEADNTLTLSLLDLSQALNMPAGTPFDIRMPVLEDPTSQALNDIGSPAAIYDHALETLPRIQAEKLRLEGSRRNLSVAKSAFYPTLSFGAGYSNSYFYSYVPGFNNASFGNQLRNNGNESVGLSLSIPIFNRMATRNQVKSARLSIQYQELTLRNTELKLHKEIEQSYYTASAAYEKYRAATVSVESARIAFRYETEKAAAGRSTIFDFNDAKTRLERSESELVQSKFEFLLRKKILDFYAGKGLDFQAY